MSGVQAKGVEDTAYYRDNTLLALNEVGGDPGGSSVRLQEFHRFNAFRARYWPHTQNATSTHDTKLGEDARIRIGALSVVAGEWSSAVRSWIVANAPFRRNTREGPAPSRNDEYRLYQTLVGVWPADGETGGSLDGSICDRVTAYMKKSAREAHVHSSWMRPNPEYEAAFEAFIRDLFTHERADAFRCAMSSLVQTILPLSFCHSISQLVLKCLIPGVPDVYQGTELWALSLTDPDNRRPIDLNAPATRLSELMHHNAPPWIGPTPSARCDDVKLYATLRLLRFRRDHAEWMARATYRPLRVRGRGTSAVVAFARSWQSKHIVVVVPRLIERPVVERGWPAGEPFWADTQVRIPSSADSWIDLWSGERVSTRAASWLPLSEMSEPAGRTHPWPWIVLTTC
jgi:(1->4)-alpha-D-glucan 1-alpha-D-glucosylmutase